MKPTTPTDDSKVFPCCMPPQVDEQGNFNGAILYPASKRGKGQDPSLTLMLCIMHLSVRVGRPCPPLVEVEA